MGAINTIVVQADGALHGYNHDGFGYIASLREAQPAWQPNAGPIVVLGAGGAARAIVVSLMDQGAQAIRVLNRTFGKAQALAQEFGSVVSAYAWDERHEAISDCVLLINTTSLGMHGQAALEIELSQLPHAAMVSDAIYVPLETPLLAQARARGHTTVNGLGMLLHQARPAFHAWFDVMPDVTAELRQAVIATL
jgi:shikimate dehydrogenase